MEKNRSIKKIIKILFIIIFVIVLSIILLDFFDIKRIFPFNKLTNQYDWYGIIGTIIGGLIGAASTCIGILFSIENEREINRKKDIEDRKRKSYSYLTLTENPIIMELSIDSISTGILLENQNVLIGENVEVNGANFFDIEYNFINLNNNYPTAVMLNDMKILYDSEIKDNRKNYKKILSLYGYQKNYKPITVKNNNIIAFKSRVLINNEQFIDIKKNLLNSNYIDIIANIKFINASGVVTNGRFSANLIQNNRVKIGNKNCLGSNKEKLDYKSENTYFIITNVEYCENYGEEIFGGK